jgi:hypothetical protein
MVSKNYSEIDTQRADFDVLLPRSAMVELHIARTLKFVIR